MVRMTELDIINVMTIILVLTLGFLPRRLLLSIKGSQQGFK